MEREDKEFILKLISLYNEGARLGITNHRIFDIVTNIVQSYDPLETVQEISYEKLLKK